MASARRKEGQAVEMSKLATVAQMAAEGPISEKGWRWMLSRRSENGLAACVVRIGRKLYLDRDAVARWLAEHREGQAA